MIDTSTTNNFQSPNIYLDETIHTQSNSFVTPEVNSEFNQSEINNENNQPITTFVLNGLDQSENFNEINPPMVTFELENLNQSAVCFVDSYSPGTI